MPTVVGRARLSGEGLARLVGRDAWPKRDTRHSRLRVALDGSGQGAPSAQREHCSKKAQHCHCPRTRRSGCPGLTQVGGENISVPAAGVKKRRPAFARSLNRSCHLSRVLKPGFEYPAAAGSRVESRAVPDCTCKRSHSLAASVKPTAATDSDVEPSAVTDLGLCCSAATECSGGGSGALETTGSGRATCARACGCRAGPGTGFECSDATGVACECSAATGSTSSAQWLPDFS